jgi:hypothetical protein
MKREALLFAAVYVTCLVLAMLFNLVDFASEPLKLSIPLHEPPNKEVYMLQALAPLPMQNNAVNTINASPELDIRNAIETPVAKITIKKKP